MGRILRLSGKSAWAEDPPSRTRRLVTNVFVEETDKPAEFVVTSYLLDRKSVVQGKSVSVRVALGGRRCIKKKNQPHFHPYSTTYSDSCTTCTLCNTI